MEQINSWLKHLKSQDCEIYNPDYFMNFDVKTKINLFNNSTNQILKNTIAYTFRNEKIINGFVSEDFNEETKTFSAIELTNDLINLIEKYKDYIYEPNNNYNELYYDKVREPYFDGNYEKLYNFWKSEGFDFFKNHKLEFDYFYDCYDEIPEIKTVKDILYNAEAETYDILCYGKLTISNNVEEKIVELMFDTDDDDECTEFCTYFKIAPTFKNFLVIANACSRDCEEFKKLFE